MQRLWNIIILLLFACAHVAASSPQAPLLVRLGLRGSKIPQFVHDLDHPWINENMGVLEQLNATEALCNAESPLRSRLPTIPDDLFKDLKVDNHDYSMRKRLGWDNARDRLLEIRSCKEALRTCQRFRVDIYRHAGGYDDKWEPQEPPQDVPPTFSDVLSSMPSLQKLEWMQPSDDTSATAIFESSFRERLLMLPTVTELQLGPNMHFLVPMAPNVETLTTSSGYKWPFPWHLNLRHELIDAARRAKHLTYFEMRADWDADLVRRVLDAMPQLQTLRLEGSMEDLYHFESGLHAPQGCRLTDILATLQKLEALRNLHLPGIWDDDLAIYFGPACGNAYDGLGGTIGGRIEERKLISGIERAGRLVVEQLPHLESLTVAATTTDPRRRTEEGKLVWPWTGRLKEHLLEEWPRWKRINDPGEDGTDEDPDGPVFETWEDDEAMLKDDWGLQGLASSDGAMPGPLDYRGLEDDGYVVL